MAPVDSEEFDVETAFREELEDQPADERVYRVALQLYEPARIAEIADRADCAADTARRHVARLAELGVLERVSETPATYQRNESYFEWRRRNRLEERSRAQLREQLETLAGRERTFRERYDADAPADVDALEHADYDEIEDVWRDLSEWTTVRRRIERLEAVRRRKTADPSSGTEAA